MDIIKTINDFGKGSLFHVGFLETIVFIIGYIIIAKIIKKIIFKSLSKIKQDNVSFYQRIVNIVIKGICIYACLSMITPLSSLLNTLWGSAGVVALIIGLAAQEAVGNFVNGLMISFFKPFKVGDLIRINNGQYVGSVVDISLRDTTIQTFENTKIIVPNSIINKEVLENISDNNSMKANFLLLEISYDSDIDKAIEIIKEEVLAHPYFFDYRTPQQIKDNVPLVTTLLTNFNESGIELKTTIYSKDAGSGNRMLCDLRMSLLKRFNKEGIDIPYPHRTVIIKKEQ